MSAELIGTLSVGVAVFAANLTTAMFLITWLRHIDRRTATLEGGLLARCWIGESTR